MYVFSRKNINLSDRIANSIAFKWYEALWCEKWGIYAFPESDEVHSNIEKTARTMDKIRNIVGLPIRVTSWYRPKNYNQWGGAYGVGGAKTSVHMQGLAVDFQVTTKTADQIRALLLPELESLNIRMENLPSSSWVHIDLREPGGGGRFFVL